MSLTWKELALAIAALPEAQRNLPATCYHDYEEEFQPISFLTDEDASDIDFPVAYLKFTEHSPEQKLNATWVSEWDGGIEVRTPCHYDSAKNIVTDIEVSDVDGLDDLVREYVELPTGKTVSLYELDESPY